MQAPAPPSATQTAAAQTASNQATATTQTELNSINQNTPTGNLDYEPTGTWADGTPKLTATQTYTPAEQQLLGSQQTINQNLGNIGVTESAKLGGLLDQPFNVDQATEDQLDTLGEQRLQPLQQKQTASLQQQLANQGISPGSEAYNNAMTLNSQSQNDATNSLILNGYQTAEQTALQQRQEPINEILALGGQTQVAQPSYAPTTQTPVAGTNVAALTNQQYQDQLAQTQSFNSGLGSIAGTVGGWLFSDKDLKTDIHSTGMETKDDIPVKTFRYKGSPMMQMGVIAQDAKKERPDAVKKVNGHLAVDYRKIGSPMLSLGRKDLSAQASPLLALGGRR